MYSISDSEDWKIRGYSKCPAYQKRLAAWLQSDAFKQKEEETADLRRKVGTHACDTLSSSTPVPVRCSAASFDGVRQWWTVHVPLGMWCSM